MMGDLVGGTEGGEQDDRRSQSRLRSLDPARVFIVDDDRADRRYLRRRLEDANLGFEVTGFPSGDAAFEQLDLLRPDCILLDIHLPGMSGLEFVHSMQVLYGTSSPSVIAITGDDSQRIGVDSMKQGVAEVVAKADLDEVDLPDLVLRTIGSRRHHQRALSQKLTAFNQLVAGTAHRVNNPAAIARLTLCSIQETLDSWLEEGTPSLEDVPRLVHMARTADDALSRIADEVRELQSQAGTSLGHVQRLTLSRAVELARSHIERSVGRPDKVILSLESSATINGDPAQLSRSIADLVENAIEAGANLVKIRTWDEGHFVGLTVEDDGPGIPPEEQELIFDPLYTTHAERGALGMGLARASLIARRHGGTIAVDCPPDGGARLHVRLPRRMVDPTSQKRVHNTSRTKARRPKILVLDRDSEIRAQFVRILERHFQLDTASSAAEARAALDRDFFDVIICDVELPSESGVTFAQSLMKANPDQATRILFSASGIVDHEAAAFVQAWENGCIRKPVSARGLEAQVENFLAALYPESNG